MFLLEDIFQTNNFKLTTFFLDVSQAEKDVEIAREEWDQLGPPSQTTSKQNMCLVILSLCHINTLIYKTNVFSIHSITDWHNHIVKFLF